MYEELEIKLYTVHCSYFATGEGITYAIMFTCALSEESARYQFLKEYGEWFTKGCIVEEGLNFDNETAKFLVTDKLKQELEFAQGRADCKLFFHANYS